MWSNDFKKGMLIEELIVSDIKEKFEWVRLITNEPPQITMIKLIGYDAIKQKKQEKTEIGRPYSFILDYGLIYSSFFSFYNIDLDNEKLTWRQFKDLLKGLGECRFTEALYYRTVDLNTINNKEERKRVSKMKEIYRLKNDKDSNKILEEFNKL